MTAAKPVDKKVMVAELAAEQAHVDKVYRHLAIATQAARKAQISGQAIYQTDRADFVREEDGTAMFERDAFSYQAAKRVAILDAEHEGLVFGRLDLTDPEIRYIGRIGVRDNDYEPLVIDWRAPAAEAFYRATPSNPMGVIRRRVLQCHGNKVVGIEDDLIDTETESDLVVIGEGALMAALSRARSHSMRDIVATIQAEQDEAIRAPYQGVTMISGGPGTGKTVVALHRAAYLLYTHRKRLENGGVLVVGPSPVFMNYIERVLPSLGEDSVTLKSVGQLATDVLGFEAQRIDNASAATVKGSLRMVTLLKRLVEEPLADVESGFELKVSAKGEILTLTGEEISKIRRQILSNQKLNKAHDIAEQELLNALYAKFPTEVDPGMTREYFDDVVSGQASFKMFMLAWWPALGPTDVLARLSDLSLVAKLGSDLFTVDEQQALSSSYQEIDAGNPNQERINWSVADIALLDELAFRIGPKPAEEEQDPVMFLESGAGVTELVTTADILTEERSADLEGELHNTYAHVLVDECQDITPMQWRMLRRRGPHASWTLVGDEAQSSYPNVAESAEAIKSLIGNMTYRQFKLTTNYRSPAEVFNLAGKVIRSVYPDADLPNAIRSTGIEPELLVSRPADIPHTVSMALANLVETVQGTIGVICPPSLFDSINKQVAQTNLSKTDLARIVVVHPLEVKGLEYDAVIVVSPDDIVTESPGGMRVLYVSLTRPTQRLITIDKHADANWRRKIATTDFH